MSEYSRFTYEGDVMVHMSDDNRVCRAADLMRFMQESANSQCRNMGPSLESLRIEQGLAFYGANIDYTVDVELECDGVLEIVATHYRGALIGVAVDGVHIGRIAFQPFTLRTGTLKKGKHRITYTLYGTRYNTLTALHNLNADKKRMYIGPIYWRSEDEAWAYEYQTRPMGILKTPILKFYKEKQ